MVVKGKGSRKSRKTKRMSRKRRTQRSNSFGKDYTSDKEGIPKTTISSSKSSGFLKVVLKDGQSIVAEPGALSFAKGLTKSKGGVTVKTNTGGIGKAFWRSMAGETIFRNIYTANEDNVELTFTPSLMGDIFEIVLNPNESIRIANGGFMASTDNIKIGGTARLREAFMGGSMFLSTATNIGKSKGKLFVTGYGEILEKNLKENESAYVDNGMFLASDIEYTLTTLSGKSRSSSVKSFIFGGEGLMMKFKGPGKLLVNSRNINKLKMFIKTNAPQK